MYKTRKKAKQYKRWNVGADVNNRYLKFEIYELNLLSVPLVSNGEKIDRVRATPNIVLDKGMKVMSSSNMVILLK